MEAPAGAAYPARHVAHAAATVEVELGLAVPAGQMVHWRAPTADHEPGEHGVQLKVTPSGW